jgi:WD40 repeat protein
MTGRRSVAWWTALACVVVAASIVWTVVGFRVLAHHPSVGDLSTGSTATAVSSPSPTSGVGSPSIGTQARLSPHLLTSITADSQVEALAFTPDGKTLAVRLLTGQVQLRNAVTGAVQATLGPTGQEPDNDSALAISPDGKDIAFGVTPRSGTSLSTVEVISIATGKVAASVHLSDLWAYSVAFSPDSKTLAIAGGRQLIFWDLVAHTTITVPTDASFMGDSMYVSFSGDGKSVVVAGNDGLVQIWNVPATGFSKSINVGSIAGEPAGTFVTAESVSPDGGTVAVSDYAGTWLWHPVTGTTVLLHSTGAQLGTSEAITAQAFSHTGNLLATGDTNGAIRLWDTAAGKLVATQHAPSSIDAVTAVAFAPDGRSLVTAQSTSPPTTQPEKATIEFWGLYATPGQPLARTSSSPVTLSALPPGTYRVAKTISIGGSWVVTLDVVQVAKSGQVTFIITTTNTSTAEGQVSCAGSPGPPSAEIELATGQLVKSTNSYCLGYPGPPNILVPSQGFFEAYAVFANSQGLDQPFTFVWEGPDDLSGTLPDITLSRR